MCEDGLVEQPDASLLVLEVPDTDLVVIEARKSATCEVRGGVPLEVCDDELDVGGGGEDEVSRVGEVGGEWLDAEDVGVVVVVVVGVVAMVVIALSHCMWAVVVIMYLYIYVRI